MSSSQVELSPLHVIWSAHPVQSGTSPYPFPRYRHTVTATATGELFLFGGHSFNTRSATSDLYVFSTRDLSTTLLQTSGAVPKPRFLHGAVLIDNTLVICGGTSTNFGHQSLVNLDSLYVLNLMSREWSRVAVVGPGPNGRHAHTTTVVDSKLFVFGGHTGTGPMNDMWALDLNCLKSQPVWEPYEFTPEDEKPLPRAAHVSVATKDRIIIFGGCNKQHYYNDTWSFDIPTRKWTELECTGPVPSPRAHHAAVLVDDVMYVFGGKMGNNCFDDLVALQLSTQQWFNFHNVGPSPCRRTGHAMASDGTRVFVTGGFILGSDPTSDKNRIRVFVPKHIKYPDPGPNAVNPNEKTTRLVQKSSLPRTQGQPQYMNSSPTEEHASYSRLELERQRDQRVAQLTDEVVDLQGRLGDMQAKFNESLLSHDQQIGQHEKELANMRAMFEANESKLVAVQSRLTDAEKDLALSKAEAVALRAQAATGSVNKDEDRVTRMVMELMERVQAIEGETASKQWNEKSIEFMKCRNED